MKRRLGPYTLVQQIALGGMAEIYLGEAETGGEAGVTQVAIKVIHPQSADDPQQVQMLSDEARLAVQLQHPNIVATYDLGQEGDEYYIVMEYVPGADLFRVLQRAADRDLSFPFEAAAYIAREVALGLDYAHRKRDAQGRPMQVIHRDISPQNVLLSRAGQVKLTDFGIAKAAHRSGTTRAGVIKGKYYYMSPEQAWGDPVDARTDIFSAGILLYEMLVGQMLYLEDDLEPLLDAVRKADIAPPSQKRAGIPRDLEQIVLRTLQKRPSDRWQTAGDYGQALTDFLRGYAPGFGAAELSGFLSGLLPRGVDVKGVGPEVGVPPRQRDPNSLLFPVPVVLAEEAIGSRPPLVKRAADQATRAVRDERVDLEPTAVTPGPRAKLAELAPPVRSRPRADRAETRKVERPETWDEAPGGSLPGAMPMPQGEPVVVVKRPSEPPRPVSAGAEPRGETRKVPAARWEEEAPAAATPPPSVATPPPSVATPPPSVATPPSAVSPSAVIEVVQVLPPSAATPQSPSSRTPPMGPASRPAWEPGVALSSPSLSAAIQPERKPWRLLLAFLLAVVIGAGGVAAVSLGLLSDSKNGQLEINSNPPGAVVQVDGAPISTPTPVRILNLDTRIPHQVVLRRPGYQPWQREVRFEPDQPARALQAVLSKDAP